MSSSSVIIGLSIITVLIIIGLTIFILVIALRNPVDSTKKVASTTDNLVVEATISRINWSEISRGFTTLNQFPSCYDDSSECKKIFAIIKAYNLEKKYMTLLDTYSMVLCQALQIRGRTCSDTFINDRIADMNTYNADANNQNAISIVKSVTDLQNNKIGKLLVMATDLIEKQMNEIQSDNAISKSDKQQIIGFNSQFYRNHYDFMNKRCP